MEAPISHRDIVPGTVYLVDVSGNRNNSGRADDPNNIVLVPRPSSDPEDPLNWSRRRKLLAVHMAMTYTLTTGIATSLQYSVLSNITIDTGIPTDALVNGTSLMFLFFGWSCLFWQPLALTFGRRGVYLISSLLCVPMMVWTAYSSSTGVWYAHRILIGIAVSPIESLPEVTVFDLFFAHERGGFMSLYILVLFGSNFIAPLFAGWFNDAFGWRWTMNFGAIIAAVGFVIMFFFMEETIYIRSTVEGEEEVPSVGNGIIQTNTDSKTGNESSEKDNITTPPAHSATAPVVETTSQHKTFRQKMKLFILLPGRPSTKQMLVMMYRPLLIIFQFPCVAWSGFIYGINLSWYTVLNGTASPVLTAAPYNFSAGLVGTVYAGPIIGAALASVWAGSFADKLALYLARKNNGVREPEQRLWVLGGAGVISTAGLILWGVGAYHEIHWIGLVFGLGMLTFGVVTGGCVAISYNVDCFKEIGGESTVGVIIIRNTIGFGIGYAVTPWYTNMGLQSCFLMAGFISLACMFTFVPMLIYGKRLRLFSKNKYWEYVDSSVAKH